MKFKTKDEAIAYAEAMAEANGGVDEFEGMNCNDYLSDDKPECIGWDGSSRRCECGNRRVYWEAYGDEKNGFTAVAVAC